MVSRGSSVKRKHEKFFHHGRDNFDNFSTWVEEFSPSNVEELAVHKKKVSEVQGWIQSALAANKQSKESRVLILTGPPGVGKTATVRALCRSFGVEMFIWSNKHQESFTNKDMQEAFYSRDRISTSETQAESFGRFLLQSSKYSLYSGEKRIILVEEFPNAFIKDSSLFHNIIRRYAVHFHHPLIFIISDNAKGESLENCLFPKDLQFTLKIKNISFNAVSPTMMIKVLTRINNSPKVQSCYKKLNKSELESIAADSMGDIRNAINSMQFMCMSCFKKPLTVQESASASKDACSSKRDSSLFLFHALGKILYSKRDASKMSNQDTLPPHLKIYEKDPLISNPEEVFEKTSISAEAFTLFLQENYIPFVDDIEANFECALCLSEADCVSALWSSRDIMNNYMVSVASRGLMFNLTSTAVNRRWRALHKPQFYENFSEQRRSEKSLKYAFRGTSLSMRQLQIDLVPFLSKIQPKDLNPAQIALSKELGEIKIKKIMSRAVKTLDEKDHFETEEVDCKTIPEVNGSNKPMTEENVEILPDEEIIIEEYDF